MSGKSEVSAAEHIRNVRNVPLSTVNDAVLILTSQRRTHENFEMMEINPDRSHLVLTGQTPEQVALTVTEKLEETRRAGKELSVELIPPAGDPQEDRIAYSGAFQVSNDHHIYNALDVMAEKYGAKDEVAPRARLQQMTNSSRDRFSPTLFDEGPARPWDEAQVRMESILNKHRGVDGVVDLSKVLVPPIILPPSYKLKG